MPQPLRVPVAPASSTTTPAKPMTAPSSDSAAGFSRAMGHASSRITAGEVAMSIAATPEGSSWAAT